MTDIHEPKVRSYNMSHIERNQTYPRLIDGKVHIKLAKDSTNFNW
jgi:G:T-mismatch repair DNA endonuclease (very short patch repair protein)